MQVLVPVDGSECSRRALEYAFALAADRGGSVDVVHFTDSRDAATDELLDTVADLRAAADVPGETEVIPDIRVSEPRSSTHIGRQVLLLVDEGGYDHVVMGHHGTGVVESLLLGSTAETVVEAGAVPVTVVP